MLLWEVASGQVSALPELSAGILQRALDLAVRHLARSARRLTVSQWNGAPALNSAAVSALERAGFCREALAYVRDGG